MSIENDVETLRQKIEEDQSKKLKIALFGQPGAGKSSLINQIIGDAKAETGVSTDVTVQAKFYEHEDLVLVDLPGYGTSKFPPNKWFQEFKPEEFDLFLCVFSGKFHESDSTFFKELKQKGRVCIFVRNKHDDLWEAGKKTQQLEQDIIMDVQKHVGSKENVYFVSCRNQTGLPELVDAIYASLDPAKQDKYARSAKAYSKQHLEAKKAACEKMVYKYAGLAAVNGFNIVPVANVGIDISIMFNMFKDLRESYGLSEERINNLVPSLLPLGKKVLDYSTKEGILILLKRFAGKQAATQFSKYIPLIGQVIASAAGFGMTFSAGKSYLDDCHELAEKILEEDLQFAKR